MSQAAGGKKGGKGPPKKNVDEDKNPPVKAADEAKDETSSTNGDKKEIKELNGVESVVKPPSAGINIREVAAKILMLAQKGEWPAVEQTLKVLEKLVAAGGEDAVSVPMAGILDPIQSGRVPTLEIDGKQYWQSKAISRFLGRKYGLVGDTPEDALEIDQIVDLLVDLRTKAEETNWRFEPNEEVREKRFIDYAKNVFPDYLERLNAVAVKNNGHLALGKLTWADFILTGIFDYLKNLVRIPDLEKKYPAFQQIIDNVYSYPQVKAYADAAPHTDE